MLPAPWEGLPEEDQLFILVTGANSGIGLATCERLIDEFLATRPVTAQLVLLPTTRSAAKARETIAHLRDHALRSSRALLPRLQARAAETRTDTDDDEKDKDEDEDERRLTAETTARRIHVLSPTLDLCDIPGVLALASTLTLSRLSNPGGGTGVFAEVAADGGAAELESVRIPRLDAVICNAGFGGWSGFDFVGAVRQMATQGLPRAVTWPTFKTPTAQRMLPGTTGRDDGDDDEKPKPPPPPPLAEVFTACFFGHYVLAHALMPLLHRRAESALAPGRIIWSSSVEATAEHFDPADVQSLRHRSSYESAKRLTDIVALTHALPSTRPFTRSFSAIPPRVRADPRLRDAHLGGDHDGSGARPQQTVAPKMYLTHPGVVVSTLFPVPWFLMWAYSLALLLARYLGSPWHNLTPYPGAASATHVALAPQPTLDALRAERVKWGSATDRAGRDAVKMTEVDGWGWEGREEDAAGIGACGREGILRKSVGRKDAGRVTTREDVARFEAQGREVWEEVERMRRAWMGERGEGGVGEAE